MAKAQAVRNMILVATLYFAPVAAPLCRAESGRMAPAVQAAEGQRPAISKGQRTKLDERLRATEAKFAKMAEGSGKAAAQMDKIEAALDGLIKAVHDLRARIHGKQTR